MLDEPWRQKSIDWEGVIAELQIIAIRQHRYVQFQYLSLLQFFTVLAGRILVRFAILNGGIYTLLAQISILNELGLQ
jgi:hypothetical protein